MNWLGKKHRHRCDGILDWFLKLPGKAPQNELLRFREMRRWASLWGRKSNATLGKIGWKSSFVIADYFLELLSPKANCRSGERVWSRFEEYEIKKSLRSRCNKRRLPCKKRANQKLIVLVSSRCSCMKKETYLMNWETLFSFLWQWNPERMIYRSSIP